MVYHTMNRTCVVVIYAVPKLNSAVKNVTVVRAGAKISAVPRHSRGVGCDSMDAAGFGRGWTEMPRIMQRGRTESRTEMTAEMVRDRTE